MAAALPQVIVCPRVILEHLDDLWLAGKANANRSAGASTTTSLGRILGASSAHLGRIFSEPWTHLQRNLDAQKVLQRSLSALHELQDEHTYGRPRDREGNPAQESCYGRVPQAPRPEAEADGRQERQNELHAVDRGQPLRPAAGTKGEKSDDGCNFGSTYKTYLHGPIPYVFSRTIKN